MRQVVKLIITSALCVGSLCHSACGGDGASSKDAPKQETPADATAQDTMSIADAAVCTVAAPTSCPAPKPHYADVAPIFKEHCVVCHNGATEDGPWPLTEYEHVADWYDAIRGELLNCTMPPVDSGMTMSDDDRLAILTWIRCGFPK
jgi:hypothetical protein